MAGQQTTIGLTAKEAKVYLAAIAFVEARSFAPKRSDILAALIGQPSRICDHIENCIQKGFLKTGDDLSLAPLEPPHIRITREVCAKLEIDASEITGPCKMMELTLARRMIARRLRRLGYPLVAIASVLNRTSSSISDYFNRERASDRSKVRSLALYGDAA